jgi:Mor family transcriptional regulator
MPWDGAPDDVIADVLRRVLEMAPSLSAEIALAVDRQARQTWGGDRVYIPRRAGEGRSERNAAIRRDFAQGERVGLLARRYGISKWQIARIVGVVHQVP